mmetsp:Transcript_18591/g.39818  ORF Transcript_18591/g.39818 Transcript_18591/m.39818 type:complete len:244 (+) Transcript_18591:994-1725(+)
MPTEDPTSCKFRDMLLRSTREPTPRGDSHMRPVTNRLTTKFTSSTTRRVALLAPLSSFSGTSNPKRMEAKMIGRRLLVAASSTRFFGTTLSMVPVTVSSRLRSFWAIGWSEGTAKTKELPFKNDPINVPETTQPSIAATIVVNWYMRMTVSTVVRDPGSCLRVIMALIMLKMINGRTTHLRLFSQSWPGRPRRLQADWGSAPRAPNKPPAAPPVKIESSKTCIWLKRQRLRPVLLESFCGLLT